MEQKVLKRIYTAKQMNRGEGMTFHPTTGERLARLSFSRSRGTFVRVLNRPMFGEPLVAFRRQIGERTKLYAYGTPYPSHWKYDPWTGEAL